MALQYLKAVVAIALASTLLTTPFVSASLPNRGFGVSLNTTTIQVYTASGHRQNALAGEGYGNPYSSNYNFTVPVTITRLSSSEDFLTLTLFTRPYDYDLDEGSGSVQVYQEQIFMNEYNVRTFIASFNLSPQSTNTAVFYLSAQLDIDNNSSGVSTAFRSAVPGAAVLNYNSTTGLWTPMTPAVYATELNEAAHVEYETILALTTEDPIDTTGTLVICGQTPDLPEDDTKNTPPTPPLEGELVSPSDPSTCTSKGGKDDDETNHGHKHHCRNNGCKDKRSDETPQPPHTLHCRNNDCKDKVIEVPKTIHCRNNNCKGKDGDKDDPHQPDWNTLKPPCKTSTKPSSSAPPSTTPKPCPPAGVRNALLQARQAPITGFNGFGIIRLTLNYGTAARPVPIRQLAIEGFGTINGAVQHARGTTDDNGFVLLAWTLRAGEVLTVTKIAVSLDAEKYRISTSNDNGASFLFWRAISIPLNWQVVGNTITDRNYRFMNKATNDIFNVQDRIHTAWVFAKTTVYNFAAKLPNVWFPGDTAFGATDYFQDGGNNVRASFISTHPDHATYTSAIAHEYGHWFHYLARRLEPINYALSSPNHNFCQQGTPNSPVVSLTEGYATAFGLSSLWQSRFQEDTGTGFCWFPFDAALATPNCLQIEEYDCDAIPLEDRDLSTDEGRIAAVLRDLIDFAGDNNGDDDGRGVTGFSDTTNLIRSRVLLDPMRDNPSSMEEYWTNFKASPLLTQAQIDAAWSVFEYQYAKFDK